MDEGGVLKHACRLYFCGATPGGANYHLEPIEHVRIEVAVTTGVSKVISLCARACTVRFGQHPADNEWQLICLTESAQDRVLLEVVDVTDVLIFHGPNLHQYNVVCLSSSTGAFLTNTRMRKTA